MAGSGACLTDGARGGATSTAAAGAGALFDADELTELAMAGLTHQAQPEHKIASEIPTAPSATRGLKPTIIASVTRQRLAQRGDAA